MITTTDEYINVHQYSSERGGVDCIHEGMCQLQQSSEELQLRLTDTYEQQLNCIHFFVGASCMLVHFKAHSDTHTHTNTHTPRSFGSDRMGASGIFEGIA
jgi:hypothetical protein